MGNYPNVNIAALTEEQACDIFLTDYWKLSHAEELQPELQYMHVDTAYNMGVETAIRMLQILAFAPKSPGGDFEGAIDGKIGPATIEAAKKVTIEQYADARKQHYIEIAANNPFQKIYLRGWNNRVEEIVQMQLNNEIV